MRHPTPSFISQTPHQFIDLLKEADTIQVSELAAHASLQSLDTALKDFEKDGPIKSFVVFIREKTVPPVPNSDVTPPVGLPIYLLGNAELLLKSGEYLLARNVYSFLLKDDIKNADALKGLGICFLKLGQIPAAKKCFKALWEFHQRPDAMLWLGLCQIHEHQDALAVECFKQITEPAQLQPAEAFDLFRELGNCQTRAGAYEEAAENYFKAIQVKPLSDNLYVNLGTLEIQRSRLKAAEDHFKQALEINPKNSRAHCGLGLVAVQNGDRTSAESALHTSLDLDPQNTVALLQLASLSTPQDAKTKTRLTAYLESDSKNQEVRYALAVMLFKASAWMQCERELDQILKAEPNHFNARQLRQELANNKHHQK